MNWADASGQTPGIQCGPGRHCVRRRRTIRRAAPPPILRAGTGQARLEFADVELHRREVAEDPRRGRCQRRHRAGVGEPGLPALDVGDLLDAGAVRMAAADEVPLACARHRVAVVGVVHQEDPPSAEFDARVRAVIFEQPAALSRQPVQHDRIAQVVAVNHVHGQPDFEQRAQRHGPDHVAAVNDGLGAGLLGLRDRVAQHRRAVVTVRNDADFHVRDSGLATPLPRQGAAAAAWRAGVESGNGRVTASTLRPIAHRGATCVGRHRRWRGASGIIGGAPDACKRCTWPGLRLRRPGDAHHANAGY